jgi:SAM-dependent methyltransferase
MLPREKLPAWFSPEPTNCWSFPRCEPQWINREADPAFLAAYGLFPGQIVANLLYYFAEPSDLVVDPFAGSGSTGLVCRDLGLSVSLFDLTPRAPGVAFADSAARIPIESGAAGFVFLDPPYWQMHRYSDDARDLSTMDLRSFAESTQVVFKEVERILRPEGHVALLMNSVWRNVSKIMNHPLDLTLMMYRLAPRSLKLVERISVTNQNFAYSPRDQRVSRKIRSSRAMLRGFRDVLVLRKTSAGAEPTEASVREPERSGPVMPTAARRQARKER